MSNELRYGDVGIPDGTEVSGLVDVRFPIALVPSAHALLPARVYVERQGQPFGKRLVTLAAYPERGQRAPVILRNDVKAMTNRDLRFFCHFYGRD